MKTSRDGNLLPEIKTDKYWVAKPGYRNWG